MSKPTPAPRPPTITFAIGIPTLNRWDLLRPSLMMYVQDFPGTHITVIDNGRQQTDLDHENVGYIVPFKNLGVAASWNLLCSRAFGMHPAKPIENHSFPPTPWEGEVRRGRPSHIIILNDDIYLGRPQHAEYATRQAELKSVIEKYPRDFYKSLHDNWCVFILPRSTWQRVGPFDENFYPAYFEDRDYRYRMRLAGLTCMEAVMFNPFLYKESGTADRDRSVLNQFEKNKEYYIAKWGGKPGHEKYRTPFNKSK